MSLGDARADEMTGAVQMAEHRPNLLRLYGLAELLERPDASVVVVGDEKCVEAAKKVFPSSVIVTSPGGPNAAMQADWTALGGRSRVLIWPDLDEPGFKYATIVSELLGDLGIPVVLIVDAQRLAEVDPTGGSREAITGWNVADAVSEGRDLGKLRTLALELAQPRKPTDTAPGSELFEVESRPGAGSNAMLEVRPSVVGLRHNGSVTCPDMTIPLAIVPPRRHFAAVLLTAAALALGAVGIAINGWFARSLGSTEVAAWLFLAVGVAADLIALVMPSIVAGLWQARRRATALVGWAVWLVAFVFAVTAGIGFASTNISDVTLTRGSRVTPAITGAQAAVADAMAARDRECKVVGKFCREREAAVAERRQVLDSAMASVGLAADPQTDAAIKLVAWGSAGMLRPAPEDFAMLRLMLLALLPQIGGLLMMVGRHSASLNEVGGPLAVRS
jgi:hypothetical protein